ncbi:hypothetical protein GE118_01095 [Mycoplasma sp. NEAQ87857]|uniref:HinT-interacting membrane complex lipoprotein P60 n=1 Tax=Mycoplasma sp. NEAQ87857 TaxID=2683967 RepID=UPI0013162614|nr:hypothetical protein [Mycoplasma sp. NEAQ87857]QGZ97389.1 hypothetical protein GE118_01095 [Mycoplasma sp. NEAQ87857]
MKLKNKLLWLSSLSIVPLFTSLSVACGKTQDSLDKIKQDNEFKNKQIPEYATEFWTAQTLASLYNVNLANTNFEEKLIKEKFLANADYKAKAYEVFKAYYSLSLFKDDQFLAKQIEMQKDGINIIDPSVAMVVNNFAANPNELNEDVFLALYNAKNSTLYRFINNVLLINKYFEINNKDQLEKINSTEFDKNKDKYDLNYFNLISYTLDKKYALLWEYKNDSNFNILNNYGYTFKNTTEYNDFLGSKDINKVTFDNFYLSPKNKVYEQNLLGFVGVKSLNNNPDYNTTALVSDNNDNNVYSGFYNTEKGQLVPVTIEQNVGVLKEPLSVLNSNAKDTQSIFMSYMNLLLPSMSEFTVDNKAVKKLSFKDSYLKDELLKIQTWFAVEDNTLLTNAQKAFVKLGYSLKEGKSKEINEQINKLPFVEQNK